MGNRPRPGTNGPARVHAQPSCAGGTYCVLALGPALLAACGCTRRPKGSAKLASRPLRVEPQHGQYRKPRNSARTGDVGCGKGGCQARSFTRRPRAGSKAAFYLYSSKGARLVSAKQETKNIINIGNKGTANQMDRWANTMSVRFKLEARIKTAITISPRDTS